jgi:carboxymethylenebutenolidase
MNLFQRYLAEEFAEDYQEGRLSRRDALKLIVSVTGTCLPQIRLATCTLPPEEMSATSAPTDLPPTDSPTTRPPPQTYRQLILFHLTLLHLHPPTGQ